ncbi:hypothetical protein HY212_06245 [Candidatus Pacearchaeota archaeon]|nr:hypothetical protein [Candidatus Pacearchaeota archaeon]
MGKIIVASLGIIQDPSDQDYVLLRRSPGVPFPNQWSLPGTVIYSGNSLDIDLSSTNIVNELESKFPSLKSKLLERVNDGMLGAAEFEIYDNKKPVIHIERDPIIQVYTGYFLTMINGNIRFSGDPMGFFSEIDVYRPDKLPENTTDYTRKIIEQYRGK